MSRRAPGRSWIPLLLLLSACGKHEFEPPDEAERVRAAEGTFSVAAFDSIAWVSDSVRVAEGNGVYAEKCRRCHGPLGMGNTDYARERGLEVPSLVRADWPRASADSLHRVIWVGHEDGMPIFGAGGITPRQIDAVAAYVLQVLRPDAGVAGGR